MRHGWVGALVIGLALAGCDGGDSGTDAGTDSGPQPTPGETAACENLLTIDPGSGCASGGTQDSCEQGLLSLRVTYAEPQGCTAEYLAWTSCLTTLVACDSGTQCPTQYATFMTCSGAP